VRVAIVGAGQIGGKRAESIAAAAQGDRVVTVCDSEFSRAEALAMKCGAGACRDWREAVGGAAIEAVIVATPNRFLREITVAALEQGKHVLCEKPLGVNAEESRAMCRQAEKSRRVLKTGFNHRHHPAVAAAKRLVEAGEIGDLYSVRCVYGHGGRPGYEKEWRASREMCGGGVLVDQGVHVIDLCRWFLGEFEEAYGRVETHHWNMEVEDNAYALLKDKRGRTACLQVSWTEWKNRFSFEVFGSKGYAMVQGLGRSYGPERLIVGREVGAGKPPVETVREFPGEDISWIEEWKEFASAVREDREPLGSGYDGLMANKLIAAVYRSAEKNRPEKIGREAARKARRALRPQQA